METKRIEISTYLYVAIMLIVFISTVL
jgi:hypothetical protein